MRRTDEFSVMPRAVLLPNSRIKYRPSFESVTIRIPFVHAVGTGLSGGALPVENGIVISLARMNRILEVDFLNARVVVEPGSSISTSLAACPADYFLRSRSFLAVDLQHRRKRSGKFRGAHCLKYGFTTTHVLDWKLCSRMARWCISAEKLSMLPATTLPEFSGLRGHTRRGDQNYFADREAARVRSNAN